jgi:hypothetical protein
MKYAGTEATAAMTTSQRTSQTMCLTKPLNVTMVFVIDQAPDAPPQSQFI